MKLYNCIIYIGFVGCLLVLGILLYACIHMVYSCETFKLSKNYALSDAKSYIDAPSSINDVYTVSKPIKNRDTLKLVDADSLHNTIREIKAHISSIEHNHENLINDTRQEVNNVIDKINGWLAFWIAILSVLCAIIPIILQYKLYKEGSEKIRDELDKVNQELLYSRCAILANSAIQITENQYIQDGVSRNRAVEGIYRQALASFKDLIDIIFSKNACITTESKHFIIVSIVHLITILNQIKIMDSFNNRKIDVWKFQIEDILSYLIEESYDITNIRIKLTNVCENMRDI